ncbi:MAG: cytochrome C [Melioribacteraceae bacterium]|nr:cytochrome C [Melioribacteraceae bacterium]
MKSIYYYLSILGIIGLFLSTTAFTLEGSEEEVSNKKIIKFSHSLHADAAECADCHTSVLDSDELSRSLLPEKEACAECHDVEDDENCEMCHYEDNYEALVYEPSNLMFSHKFHSSSYEEMTCAKCHVEESKSEEEEITIVNPEMISCSSCHSDSQVASMNCETCHTTTDNLTPENHLTNDFKSMHFNYAENDGENCVMCHSNDFCEACHVSGRFDGTESADASFGTLYSPHKFLNNAKEQKLSRVHEIGYRFTHGIDAKGKSMECSTCHQAETFCVECHSDGGGEVAMNIVPMSHMVSDFTTKGVGTGGGEHAVLARRDIENCMVCHDVQGADPNCIMCHTDTDGIKGTNPKTHDSSISDISAVFHDDDGAVCYTCHITASASTGQAGNGFCGYCHGSK